MKTLVREEVDVQHVRLNGHHVAPVKPSRRYTLAFALAIAAGIGFMAAGGYTAARGFDAKNTVAAEFKAQNITTPEDASIPNAPVVDARTAQSQADVIWKHMMEATKGKTYAQLERTDPARTTAFNGSMLRGSLLSGVLAWNVANLVIGLGAFIAAVGILFIAGAVLLRRSRKA